MTEDANKPLAQGDDPTPAATPQGGEAETTTPEPTTPQPTTQQPVQPTGQAQTGQTEGGEETVPRSQYEDTLKALREERRKFRDRLRRVQRGQSEQPDSQQTGQTGQTQPDQNILKMADELATYKLKDGARELLRDYPELPKHIKRAILRNPRGYIKSTTRNVDDGLLDIQDFVEDEIERVSKSKTPPKKTVQVAGSNTPDTGPTGATPAKIQAILDKPVDEWTKADQALLKEHKESQT